ncbi:MAG: L-seryl-tRNA(Sec) selenium transferase [Thermovirgaceae bacterium]
MDQNRRNMLRQLPAMDELLSLCEISFFEKTLGRKAVKAVVSNVIGEVRKSIRVGDTDSVSLENIRAEIEGRLLKYSRPSLNRVVNATGVVVHTNLGRSCLAPEAVEAVSQTAAYYSTLEYDIESGSRGQRNDHVEWILSQLTGSDGAVVVNNNAGAVLLLLSAFASGEEVIVSRGELVEIGGSFRIPDIMALSGAKLVEVGTTNRTRLEDYKNALSERTRMILKVHPSNFRIVGFHSSPSRKELAELAKEKDLLFAEDLGSGVLVDCSEFGLFGEPTVRECIEAGVDLVTFSGDKLLGGPQAGSIVGRRPLVEKLKKHPFLRALRIDKMTLAAMERTLRLYLEGKYHEIPTLRMLSITTADLEKVAVKLREKILEVAGGKCKVTIAEVEDVVGGGAFPETSLEGKGIRIESKERDEQAILDGLRRHRIPVIGVVENGAVVLHVRTLLDGDERIIPAAVKGLFHD